MLGKGRSNIITSGQYIKLNDGGGGATAGTTTITKGANAANITLTLPAAAGTLARTSGETFTSTILTTPDINGGTADSLTSLSVRDTSAAYDVTVVATSSPILTAGRTLTLNMNNAARSISLAGDLSLAGNLSTSGAYALTLTLSNTTNVTLPTSGTLSTLAGTETLSGKTLTLPKINDTSSDHTYNILVSELVASRDITLPLLTGNDTFVFQDHQQTLTQKTLTSPDINGGTADSLTSLSIRDTSAAFDVTVAAVSSSALTAGRTLMLDMVNAARSIKLQGNIDLGGTLTTANALSTSGNFALTLTTTNTTNITLPTTGTLATLAGTEEFTNKTLTSPKVNENVALTTTATKLNYLTSAAGTTGTTSTNIVFSTSPSLTTPSIAGGTATGLTGLAIRDTSAAFDVTLAATSSSVLTAGRTLTLDMVNAARSIKLQGNVDLGGNLTTASSLTTSGAFALTLTATNTTNATLPEGTNTLYSTKSGSITSSQLATSLTDETGSGSAVFGTAPTLDKPVLNQADMTQAASATTPASGKSAIYVNSGDAKLHIVDSSGNDTAIGSGGAGSRNYLSDWFDGIKSVGSVTSGITATGNITISTTLWQASDTTKLTVANVTSGGLRGDAMTNANHKCLKLDHVAVAAAFVQTPVFQLDPVDQGKPVSVTFDHGTVTTADDYQVYIVRYNSSGTYQEQIPIVGVASATSPYSARMAAGSTTSFRGFFVAGSTSTDYYALRFYRNSASDTTDINIDTLYVGPGSVMQGAAVTDWYTPTTAPVLKYGSTTATNTSSISAKLRRQGDSCDFKCKIIFNGAANANGTIRVTIPDNLVVDTTKLAAASAYEYTAIADFYTNSKYYHGVATVVGGVGTNYLEFTRSDDSGGTAANWAGNTTAGSNVPSGAAIANNDWMQFTIIGIPISGWSSNVTMADRAVEEYASNYGTSATADDPTSFAYGAAGSQFANITAGHDKTVRFQTPISPTDKISVEITTDGGVTWVDVAQSISGITNNTNQTTTTYGMGWYKKNATDIYVNFGTYRGLGTGVYGSAGAAWSGIAASNTFKWRVRKVSGGAAVGFPVSARNVVGDTSGQTVPTGYIGQVIEPSSAITTTAATPVNTEVDVNNASIALTPGVWLIQYSVTAYYTTGATSGNGGYTVVCITNSSNTHIGKSERMIYGITRAGAAITAEGCLSASTVVNISASTTYKLRVKYIDNAGTGSGGIEVSSGTYDATFYAVRIA